MFKWGSALYCQTSIKEAKCRMRFNLVEYFPSSGLPSSHDNVRMMKNIEFIDIKTNFSMHVCTLIFYLPGIIDPKNGGLPAFARTSSTPKI